MYKELIRNQENISLRFLIVQLYIYCNYFKEAYHELEYIFEVNSKHPDLYLLLGKIYYKARMPTLILPLLEKISPAKFHSDEVHKTNLNAIETDDP